MAKINNDQKSQYLASLQKYIGCTHPSKMKILTNHFSNFAVYLENHKDVKNKHCGIIRKNIPKIYAQQFRWSYLDKKSNHSFNLQTFPSIYVLYLVLLA